MSSPIYTTDHGNGLTDQYGSNSGMNGNNGSIMCGDMSSATIIGAMRPYNDESDKSSNQASSLPTSSTTSTISTSNTNATFSSVANLGSGGTDDVCRDYLRNMCRRGKSCRFKHPDNDGDKMANNGGNNRNESFVFCHDFQNRECRRDNCRFIHISKKDEEIFNITGKLPASGQAMSVMSDSLKDPSTPICKDFVNGICRRGPGRCKFRHPVTNESYNQSPSPTSARNAFDGRNGQGQRGGSFAMCSTNSSPHNLDAYGYGRGGPPHVTPTPGANMSISSSYGYGNDQYADAGNPNKRKRFESMYTAAPYTAPYNDQLNAQVHGYGMQSSSYYAARSQIDGRSYLDDENAALRRRIDELKKQVAELITTNEYLMEQINQLRVQNGPAAAAAVALATATSVASLPPPQSTATAVGISSISAGPLSQSISLQPPPPPPASAVPQLVATPVAIGAMPTVLPPSSIVSSIASISLPTVTAPVSLVNSSGAASLVSYTPSLVHSSNAWPLGVDQ